MKNTVWRTNNAIGISNQQLRMHMGNHRQPEPWMFLSNKLIIIIFQIKINDVTHYTDIKPYLNNFFFNFNTYKIQRTKLNQNESQAKFEII